MACKLSQGSVIPEFWFDTPYEHQKSFYEMLKGKKPVFMVFLRNFGHPLSRHYIMEYIKTADRLFDARLVCVVQTAPQVIAQALPANKMPYQLICDPEGALYQFFKVETETNWLKSYSFKGMKIIKEAKKQGFQEDRSAPQQLPLTAVIGEEGKVLFAHYGQSITDMPDDCAAMQRVMEGLLDAMKHEAQKAAEQEEAKASEDAEQEEAKASEDAEQEERPEAEQAAEWEEKAEDTVLAEPAEQPEEPAGETEEAELRSAETTPDGWQMLSFEQEEPAHIKPTGCLPGTKPREKKKIDLAALGFGDTED